MHQTLAQKTQRTLYCLVRSNRVFLMNKFLISALALLSVSLCAAALHAGQAMNIQDIKTATDGWRAAYDSRDPDKIVSRYAPDAVFWGTTARTIASTPKAVAHYFSNAAKRPNARVVIGEQHVRMYGDVATNAGYYTFTGIRDGQQVSYPARFSFVFHKLGEQWLIVQHHSSQLPP